MKFDQITALSSVAIAMFALGLAVYEGRESRKHDRLLVEPRVEVVWYRDSESVHLSSFNLGLGPAEVAWFTVRHNGELVSSWADLLRRVAGPNGPKSKYTYNVLSPGLWIAEGHEGTLLRIPRGPLADLVWAAFLRDEIATELCRCTVYDECRTGHDRETGPENTDCADLDVESLGADPYLIPRR